jgi:hypothetical protein
VPGAQPDTELRRIDVESPGKNHIFRGSHLLGNRPPHRNTPEGGKFCCFGAPLYLKKHFNFFLQFEFGKLRKLEEFYASLTKMLNEFRLDGDVYRFAVYIGNPHYVYQAEPTQQHFENHQGQMAAEQFADSCGIEFGAEQVSQQPMQQEVCSTRFI